MLPKEILPKRSTTKGEYCYYRMYVLFADRVSGKKLAYYSCHPDDFMDAAFTASSSKSKDISSRRSNSYWVCSSCSCKLGFVLSPVWMLCRMPLIWAATSSVKFAAKPCTAFKMARCSSSSGMDGELPQNFVPYSMRFTHRQTICFLPWIFQVARL